jgi:hypothetical protein
MLILVDIEHLMFGSNVALMEWAALKQAPRAAVTNWTSRRKEQ